MWQLIVKTKHNIPNKKFINITLHYINYIAKKVNVFTDSVMDH